MLKGSSQRPLGGLIVNNFCRVAVVVGLVGSLTTFAEPDGGLPLFIGDADPLMAKQAPLLLEVNALVRDWGVESPFAQPEGR